MRLEEWMSYLREGMEDRIQPTHSPNFLFQKPSEALGRIRVGNLDKLHDLHCEHLVQGLPFGQTFLFLIRQNHTVLKQRLHFY